MKKIIIALIVLVIVGLGVYYFVFNKERTDTPAKVENPVTNSTVDQASNQNIEIKGFAFTPTNITIKVGTKVTWTNNDSVPHTVTSDNSNILNSATLPAGGTYSFTFNDLGTFPYHCSIHPMMKAQIVVTK